MTTGMLDAPCALLHGAIVAGVRHGRQTATASFQRLTLLMPSGYFRNATGQDAAEGDRRRQVPGAEHLPGAEPFDHRIGHSSARWPRGPWVPSSVRSSTRLSGTTPIFFNVAFESSGLQPYPTT
jgi:hypothetical protein